MFKDIEYDNLNKYEINELGEIRNKETLKIIKPYIKNNYYCIKLVNENKRKEYRLHILLAETFLKNPNEFINVNHKDNNTLNNNLNNLEFSPLKKYKEHKINKQKIKEFDLIGYKQIGYIDGLYITEYRINKDGEVLNNKYNHIKPYIDENGNKIVRIIYNDKDTKIKKIIRINVNRLIGKLFLENGEEYFKNKDYIVIKDNENNLKWINKKDLYNYKNEKDKNKENDKKIIIKYDLENNKIKEYNNFNEICKELNIKITRSSDIKRCCEGERKTCCGYKWKYKK